MISLAKMTRKQIRYLQKDLNKFTERFLLGIAPLIVDGRLGPMTRKRIRTCKKYIGYVKKHQTSRIDHEFRMRLRYPKKKKYNTLRQLERGARKRVAQRREYRRERRRARRRGVGRFDGKPCAYWMIKYLKWARAHGWRGQLVSGWRSPEHSEKLCYDMCGKPTCPGRCAGRYSRHSQKRQPNGAIDVSDYIKFAEVIAHCPYNPRIFNALPRDRVHFSSTGN